jgi:hypothetical protein
VPLILIGATQLSENEMENRTMLFPKRKLAKETLKDRRRSRKYTLRYFLRKLFNLQLGADADRAHRE